LFDILWKLSQKEKFQPSASAFLRDEARGENPCIIQDQEVAGSKIFRQRSKGAMFNLSALSMIDQKPTLVSFCRRGLRDEGRVERVVIGSNASIIF
jgi:hypothetical protein